MKNFSHRWKELAAAFLKLGVISYGGGAMMGIMHAEIASTRRWLTDARYLEGVSLVSMLQGPPAVQLAVFIGYERAGWRGGVLAGLCFMLPAFLILLGLTLLYSAFGTVGPVRTRRLLLESQCPTFGGGLAILASVQEHVVNEMHWLTSREFLDGLALGQLTPGPTLMIAAYVGYKVASLSGAIVSALCIFAPAFFLMLPLLPVLERFESVLWIKAAMRGIGGNACEPP